MFLHGSSLPHHAAATERSNLPMPKKVNIDRTIPTEGSGGLAHHGLSILLEASQALVQTLDMQTVLQTIVEKTVQLLELDTGAIYLIDGGRLTLRATTPPLPADLPETFRHTPLDKHPHIRHSLDVQVPVIVTDASDEPFSPEEREIVDGRGLRSILYLPLVIEDRVLGILIVGTVEHVRGFSPGDINFCSTISNQAALVIENAALLERSKAHAAELERQIQERRLAESLLRLQSAALNAAANAIVITDREGRIQWVNPAMAALTGFSGEEAIGRNPRDLIRSGIHDKEFFENLWKTILAGKVWHGEIVNRRKDGTLYTEEQSITPVTDDRGEITHFIAIKQDVTARIQADTLQRTIYEVARASASSITLEELFAEIHRIVSQAIDAKNFFIALYDDATDIVSFPYFVDEVDTVSPPGKPGHGLTDYILRTGKSVLCDDAVTAELARLGEADIVGVPSAVWLGVPLKVDGKVIGVLAVQHYTDPKAYGVREQQMLEFVSSEIAHAIDRKRTAENMEHSLSLLAATLESTADGILVVDNGGRIVRYNQRFMKMWNIPEDILATRDDEKTLTFVLEQLKDPEGFLKKVKELYTTPGAESHDELEFRDGRIFERYSLPQTVGQAFVGRVWSFRDVTKNRQLQKQVIQSQKMESLGTLASGIAHDFNNILSIIIGHAAELEKRCADRPALMKNVEAVSKAGRRGSNLVRQMLTFARKTELVYESVDLNELVREVGKLLHETFPRTVSVEIHVQQDLAPIEADATQVHQVLLNLCLNGRDAMPNGGVLAISTNRVSGASLRAVEPKASITEYVVLSVSDTGIGMNAETQARIFEPFFSTKEYGKGTGLGLAVVFGIMETHKGFVTVASEEGKGTTFRCCFPVLGKTLEAALDDDRSDEGLLGGHETILVVEDEQELRELYKVTFERYGYSVLGARDGEEGFAVYLRNRDRIDIVLSDIGLPKMSGEELYRRLKAVNPHTPVVLASGFIEPRMKARMLAEGVRDVVEKPYSPTDILATIRRVLDRMG